MKPLAMILTLLLPISSVGYTLDTEHALYDHMVGIYVFDNRTDDGENIAGTGTMVGTVEDADGFDTPITQTHQDWYNDFGSAYTVIIWHSGMTLDSWEAAFSISDDTITWSRYSSNSYFKTYHGGVGNNMPTLTTAEVASEMMLSFWWDDNNEKAYDGDTEIATDPMANDPKTDSSTSTMTIGGSCTVTRVYIFDTDLTTTQLGNLESDPDSIFTSESGPSGAQIFTERSGPDSDALREIKLGQYMAPETTNPGRRMARTTCPTSSRPR